MLRKLIKPIVCFFLLLFIDQWTKFLAILQLKGHSDIVLIQDVLEFHYLENFGAAFGMLQNKQILLLVITAFILAGICMLLWKMPQQHTYMPLRCALVLIMAGAVGNMIDRLLYGYVVDFIYIAFIQFPVFNLADCYVVVGVVMLLICMFFVYSEEDLEAVYHKDRKNKKKEDRKR